MEIVTVIIPVYKTKPYLKSCVYSVRNQTYKNLEIILVDDGSPDGAGELCERLKDDDPRIVVIHQSNQGLSSARNAALDISSGEYVTFVDSDDTIDTCMIENLVNDIEIYDADIAECQFHEVFGKRVIHKSPNDTKVCTPEQALLIDLSSIGGSVAACGKLYRKKIFNEHRFQVGRLGEDTFAIIDSLRQAKRIVIDHRPMYYYYHRNNSITTNTFNERTMDAIIGAKRNLDIVAKVFPGALPGAIFRYDWSYLWVLDRILLDEEWRDNKYIDTILLHVRKNIIRILKSQYFTRKRKIGALMISVSPALYRKLVLFTWRSVWN